MQVEGSLLQGVKDTISGAYEEAMEVLDPGMEMVGHVYIEEDDPAAGGKVKK